MNPNQVMSPDEQNVIEFSESPGRRLRVQRQSRGLEVERIAAQLHLRVGVIEALEHDRYQDLPGPVFIAGYLRNYARLLGIDPEPLLTVFRATHPDPEPETTGLRASPLPRQELTSGNILVRLISVALVVAVLALLALWWQNRRNWSGHSPPTMSLTCHWPRRLAPAAMRRRLPVGRLCRTSRAGRPSRHRSRRESNCPSRRWAGLAPNSLARRHGVLPCPPRLLSLRPQTLPDPRRATPLPPTHRWLRPQAIPPKSP